MVQIVMSTYNGEKYICEQLDSLLNQTYENIDILVRDDGSTDGTVEILQNYSDMHDNIRYFVGENIGVTASFFALLQQVDGKAKYIATCDQDDVWLPDKVETAVAYLEKQVGPTLYCGRPKLVNEQLEPMKEHLREKEPVLSFGNALIENICTGCTMVMNRALFEAMGSYEPQHALVHDWWIYQLALGIGKVIYDANPHILYRQHGSNAIGLDTGRKELIKRQIHNLRRFHHKYTLQAEELLERYSIAGDNRRLGELMVGTRKNLVCRLRILWEKDIRRQGVFDTILFKMMLFVGYL